MPGQAQRPLHDLLLLLGKGDEEAAEEFYARVDMFMFKFALRLAGNTPDAKDVFSAAWGKVLSARTFKPQGDDETAREKAAMGWLKTVVRSAWGDFLRTKYHAKLERDVGRIAHNIRSSDLRAHKVPRLPPEAGADIEDDPQKHYEDHLIKMRASATPQRSGSSRPSAASGTPSSQSSPESQEPAPGTGSGLFDPDDHDSAPCEVSAPPPRQQKRQTQRDKDRKRQERAAKGAFAVASAATDTERTASPLAVLIQKESAAQELESVISRVIQRLPKQRDRDFLMLRKKRIPRKVIAEWLKMTEEALKKYQERLFERLRRNPALIAAHKAFLMS